MDNPKIKIESDGIATEVYLNGERISDTLIDFSFRAHIDTGLHVEYGGERFKRDKNGKAIIENNEIVTEKFCYDSHKAVVD